MNQQFAGWDKVAQLLRKTAEEQRATQTRLNAGQCASLEAIAKRIGQHGIIVADEVGMGKTRIAVELVRAVNEAGGRAAIVIPPGLGFQWRAELRDGGVESEPVIRSLMQYLGAWIADNGEPKLPWHERPTVLLSHSLSNWRLGKDSARWRWALLPELYAHWRKLGSGRVPRGYRDNEESNDRWRDNAVRDAAISICQAIPKDEQHPAHRIMTAIAQDRLWPNSAREPGLYNKDAPGTLRPELERSIGLGLGIFDLIVIDEAHKSRNDESGLSRMLNCIVHPSDHARRLAMTATPVELDAGQWRQTLHRISIDGEILKRQKIVEAVNQYAAAVKAVRLTPANLETRQQYKAAAGIFHAALSPYVLRRDKREDADVIRFRELSGNPGADYRRKSDIRVDVSTLPPAWKRAVCAAEALSVVATMAGNAAAKRLRLTFGNGHGIGSLIDRVREHDDEDLKQRQFEEARAREDGTLTEQTAEQEDLATSQEEQKRRAREQWWSRLLADTFGNGNAALLSHPAILEAVKAIEAVTHNEPTATAADKVLVFGRFTLPLRALVYLLNAREMLRCLSEGRYWPQSRVQEKSGNNELDEWSAVRAASEQLGHPVNLGTLDQTLRDQYAQRIAVRRNLRTNLIARLEEGLTRNGSPYVKKMFAAFRTSAAETIPNDAQNGAQTDVLEEETKPQPLVAKALLELIDTQEVPPADQLADAFSQLIMALSDQDAVEAGDVQNAGDLDDNNPEAARLQWQKLYERLKEEYGSPQGGFARLMFGQTKPETRRMLQLAFNRPGSFPRVLVAQSMVGREGLNLHKACRIVVLLHPEWNPGVVEQQIGRVDRVGSHWASRLEAAAEEHRAGAESAPMSPHISPQLLPHIEIRPVIFGNTYDEYNWEVLQERWDNLRAQLHGVVIPESAGEQSEEMRRIIEELTHAAPDFSPSRSAGGSE